MNREEIKQWLDRYRVDNYTINDDLTVDVDSDILLFYNNITEIPFQFGIIKGVFHCMNNHLKSLKGGPKVVNGYFNCIDNELTSLENCPELVHGNFDCRGNKLISLENSSNISGDIYTDIKIEGFEEYYNKHHRCYAIPASAVKAYYLHKKLSQIVPQVTKIIKKNKL